MAAVMDRRLRYQMSAALWSTPVYRMCLWGRRPQRLALILAAPWPGDPRRGEALLQGRYGFLGETIAASVPPWSAAGASVDWQAALHGFAWLADLAALGSDAARGHMRMLTQSWLEHHRRWHRLAWRADVVGERLHSWIVHAALLAPAGDQKRRAEFLASLARQTRHLARVASWEVAGIGRLKALRGLLASLLALDAGDRRLDAVLRVIEREAETQMLPDGGHVARSPALQLEAMRHMIDMRAILDTAAIEVPGALAAAIERAAPMLRFFRHGDGRLALFNDTIEREPVEIDLALARSEAKGRPPASAPRCGFERLHAGKSLVIIDCGVPPSAELGGYPHAGTLAFELSHGRERLIVNCGAYRGAGTAWHAAARTTAAHSTLVVADTPSSDIDEYGCLGRRPSEVTCERAEEDGNQWVAASHNGYQAHFGLVHARQLFLTADGEDFRGEDRLTGRAGQSFAIRFHLHPHVQASLTQDGGAALLRLPSGIGWRLRAEGAVMSLAESVYLGSGEVRKGQQVVLAGHVGTQGASVKWAIRREGRRATETAAAARNAP